jgi:SAM-dependent methyltransferase
MISVDIVALRDNLERCSWPGLYYSKVQFLIELHKTKTLVEIGVAYGLHALHIVSNNADLKYCGIDPYLPNYDNNDPFSIDVARLFPERDPLDSMNRLHSAVAGELDQFSERARLIRESSKEAARSFESESIDMVFVDANHKLEHALEDIKIWFSKLRPGGLLVGDDYNWPEVEQAAKSFSKEKGVELWLLGSPLNDHTTFVFRKKSNK